MELIRKTHVSRVKVYKKSNMDDDQQPSTSGLQAMICGSSSSPQSESSDNNSLELHLPKKSRISLKKLKSIATVADRTGVSDRNAALIASATLEDYNLISSEDISEVIEKNKIRRAQLSNIKFP